MSDEALQEAFDWLAGPRVRPSLERLEAGVPAEDVLRQRTGQLQSIASQLYQALQRCLLGSQLKLEVEVEAVEALKRYETASYLPARRRRRRSVDAAVLLLEGMLECSGATIRPDSVLALNRQRLHLEEEIERERTERRRQREGAAQERLRRRAAEREEREERRLQEVAARQAMINARRARRQMERLARRASAFQESPTL